MMASHVSRFQRATVLFLLATAVACTAGNGTTDSGTTAAQDSGPLADSGVRTDAGSDAGPARDAAVMTPDAAVVTPDAAVVTPDAAVVTPDAAVVTPDAAVVTPDAAVVTPDAAVVTPDAAMAPDAALASVPTVVSTVPANGALGVVPNTSVVATFSEAMDPATITSTSFTVAVGTPAVQVAGTVTYANLAATFAPTAPFAANSNFTATLTTTVQSAGGAALAANHVWTFSSGDTPPSTLPVNLGMAGNYVILAQSAVATVPPSAITGNVAVSPAAATFLTGFSLTDDATNTFATSPQVTGKLYAADNAPPTPANLTTAVGDMLTAYTDAAGRTASVSELGTGNIGGMTLTAGVYKWGGAVSIPSNITLTGTATDIWIFQVAQDVTMADGVTVLLDGGALPKNVFWQVAGKVDMGMGAHMEGVVLCKTAITLMTGASIRGRLLAQTAVGLDASAVMEPNP